MLEVNIVGGLVLLSSGNWRRVFGWVACDLSKGRRAFIFSV